jgi:hypothetical protein
MLSLNRFYLPRRVRSANELPVEGPCLNVSSKLTAAIRLARGSGGDWPSRRSR